ncbi:hypothetical protein OH77DRAFT_1522241 [Trametes cingulata]|nr:hypothetical protein OH77DRAFT_1522241 [Trametes cingulata]
MAAASGVVPPRINIDETFGAFLIGTLVGVMLYGMTVHQTYQYFRTYPEDEHTKRLLVTALFVLETFHIMLCSHVCYVYLIGNYNYPPALKQGNWSLDLLTLVSGVIIILSQSYFARRVYLLGGGSFRLLVLLTCLLLIGELGFFTAATVQAFEFPAFTHFQSSTWLISAGAAMAACADILLAGVLVVVLRRNAVGMKRLGTVIEILILYTISTGLLTSLVDLLSLVFSLFWPSNLIYTAFGIVSTKLYANSLLAALNARKHLAERAITAIPCNTLISPLGSSSRALPISMVQPSPTFTLQERLQYREVRQSLKRIVVRTIH